MRFLTTLLALTAAATAAVVKKDMPTGVHLPLEVFDIASTKSNPSIVARQEPPFQTKNLRYADIYQSSSDDCTADRKMLSFEGGRYGEPEQRFCQDFDTQSVRSFTIESGTGCGAYIQEGTCETGGAQRLLELGGVCAQAFTEEAAPTAQSLLVLCNAGAGDLGIPPKSLKGREEDSNAFSNQADSKDVPTGVHLPPNVFGISNMEAYPDIVAKDEASSAKFTRSVKIYECGSDNCVNPLSLLTLEGGEYGEPEQSICRDFSTETVRSYNWRSGSVCDVFIQEGTCQTGGAQKAINIGSCSNVFLEEGSPTAQSLLVVCSAGAPPKSLKGREEDSNAISERGEQAVSLPRADQRWVKYWLTDNDQCQTKADDSGTIYSGNMGDNFSEQCQTRDALGGPTWVDVSDSHGCDLYIQQGDCDATGSLPLPLSQGQCVRVSPEWEGSVWSLKAVCSG